MAPRQILPSDILPSQVKPIPTRLADSRRLRQVDVKAEHFERQVTRVEQERDEWERKHGVRGGFFFMVLFTRYTSVRDVRAYPQPRSHARTRTRAASRLHDADVAGLARRAKIEDRDSPR